MILAKDLCWFMDYATFSHSLDCLPLVGQTGLLWFFCDMLYY